MQNPEPNRCNLHLCRNAPLCRTAQKRRPLRNACSFTLYIRSVSGSFPGATAHFVSHRNCMGAVRFPTTLPLPTPALSVSGSWVEIRSCFLSAGAPAPRCFIYTSMIDLCYEFVKSKIRFLTKKRKNEYNIENVWHDCVNPVSAARFLFLSNCLKSLF